MVTSTLTWADTKHRAIEGFRGELPNADTEQTILDAFEQEPLATIHALDQVIEDFRAGKARSGWAIWRTRIQTAARTADVHVLYADSRQKQLTIAETWIRNTGGYIDRETELVEELFGDLGKLRDWPDLEPRIVALWHEHRERFAKAEQEAIDRQTRQAAAIKTLRQVPRSQCKFCGRTHRSQTDACAEHRYLLEEDYRVSDQAIDPHRDAWLEEQAAAQAEHEDA